MSVVPPIGVEGALLHDQWHAYFEMSATALVFWDYFLTFNDELVLVWNRPKNFVTLLFVINRYLAMIAQLVTTYAHVSSDVSYHPYANRSDCAFTVVRDVTPPIGRNNAISDLGFGFSYSCKFAIAYWLIGTSILQLLVTDCIVWLCVCALYGHAKKIRYPLLALLSVCILISIAIIAVVGSHSRGSANLTPDIKRCSVYTPYHGLWLFWIPILVYESTTLVLVSRQFRQYRKNRSAWTSPLLELVLKDTLLYLAVIFVLFIGNAYLFGNPDPTLSALITPLTLVVLSILGNRMLLNLRNEGKRAANNGEATTLELADTMRFAARTYGAESAA